jgi:hypothetical protein
MREQHQQIHEADDGFVRHRSGGTVGSTLATRYDDRPEKRGGENVHELNAEPVYELLGLPTKKTGWPHDMK